VSSSGIDTVFGPMRDLVVDSAGEEWGEAQLIEAVRRELTQTSREIIRRMMQRAFVAGARQHDDMTLVVIRQT
jgi:serine phosphatase RsbU (regulator of sigma subunit)